MHRNWPYSLSLTGRNPDETEGPALGEDLGAMPMPFSVSEDDAEFQGVGGTAAALGGWHMTVNPNSENKDAVSQVIQAAMADDFQLTLLEIQGWLPPKPELFNSDAARNVPVVGRYMDTLRVAGENAIARPVTQVWPDESSTIAQKANEVVDQTVSAQQGMNTLKSDLQDIEGG